MQKISTFVYERSLKEIPKKYQSSKLKCIEGQKTSQIMPYLLEKKRKRTDRSQKEKRKT